MLESGAIVANDGINTINILIPEDITEGASIVLSGKFGTVQNNSANLEIEANGTIDKLELNKGTIITGNVTIKILILLKVLIPLLTVRNSKEDKRVNHTVLIPDQVDQEAQAAQVILAIQAMTETLMKILTRLRTLYQFH